MRIMRNSFEYPWFIQNNQMLQEAELPSLETAASTYAKNLRTVITNHQNPKIQSLSTLLVPNPTEKYLCPCFFLIQDL